MKNAILQSKQVNDIIKQSEEYREYIAAKKELMENEELCEKFTAFRLRNNELQSHMGVNPFDEINNLVREYDAVLNEYTVSRFMRAEQRICKLMQKVYVAISDGLEFGEING